MDDDDEEEEGPSIGGRSNKPKLPNPLNEPKRMRQAIQREELERALKAEQDRQAGREQEQDVQDQADEEQDEEEAQQEQAQQEQAQEGPSKIPSFGDGSRIIRDWTRSWPINDPIDQYEDTCGSVVFTHLLEAVYNKDKPIAQHRELSTRDLADYIKGRTKDDKYAFRNLNIPINYIRSTGLYKKDKTSGVKTKGDFDHKQDATKQYVYEKLEKSPLGIVLESTAALEEIGNRIYLLPHVGTGKETEHAMFVVGRGVTKTEVEFLVVQNSWGTEFGNDGYCRISLPEIGRFKIFWPC